MNYLCPLGTLASDIVTGNWEVALEELITLRETIDSRPHPPPPFSPDLYFFTRAPPVSSRVRTTLREIVKVIQTEEYQYQDPKALNEAVDVVETAFFWGEFKGDILDDARYLISIRRLISDLSECFNLTRDEGEKWIVNLIRETRMGADAKIYLEKNVIEINRPPQLVYQSVTEKTRALRTQTIGAAVARAGAVPLENQMQT
ncbi:hypothetical protein M378DRAFT_16548 [Amanita muscaria Koide BX008]|uniref:Uncharacterized protein n=1 Tax=Amanita muscaria (strain Koide BX008) TaxID=946122 RepID=A0A0C2WK19_AMAMK|nr:hypothetical protein M378DRAFT_16548 [Amanita muscaria Koide BX008]